MEKKLNNLLDIKAFSEGDFVKKPKVTKRTEVAKDILHENVEVIGKDIFKDKPKQTDKVEFKNLNNLISLDDFTQNIPDTSVKATKRTDVAKDIIKEEKETGKVVFSEKPKSHDEIIAKKLNNLISLDEFTEKEIFKDIKTTKRTDVAKDVLQEKKKKDDECEEEKECDEEKPKKGLSAKQKKLPEALQKAILKKQK